MKFRKNMDLRLTQLFQWQMLLNILYNKECNGKVVIDDTIKTAIDEYYKQYGAK